MLFTWPKRAATGSPSSMRNPRIVDFMCKLQLGLQLDSFHSNTSIGHEMFRKLDGPCASVPLPKKNRHIYIYIPVYNYTHTSRNMVQNSACAHVFEGRSRKPIPSNGILSDSVPSPSPQPAERRKSKGATCLRRPWTTRGRCRRSKMTGRGIEIGSYTCGSKWPHET